MLNRWREEKRLKAEIRAREEALLRERRIKAAKFREMQLRKQQIENAKNSEVSQKSDNITSNANGANDLVSVSRPKSFPKLNYSVNSNIHMEKLSNIKNGLDLASIVPSKMSLEQLEKAQIALLDEKQKLSDMENLTDAESRRVDAISLKLNEITNAMSNIVTGNDVQARQEEFVTTVNDSRNTTSAEKENIVKNYQNDVQQLQNKAETQKNIVREDTRNQSEDLVMKTTIQAQEVTYKQFKQWLKEANDGNSESLQKAIFAAFSDFDGKYMPKIVGLGWAGFDGGMVEKGNKFRMFGPDKQKHRVGELQMYNIVQNNPEIATQFILKNAGVSTLDQVWPENAKQAQNALFKKLSIVSEIQQLITGKPSNASVDIPQILAGNEVEYLKSLLAKQETVQYIQDNLSESKLSRLQEILTSLGIAWMIPGGYARFEERDITLEDIEKGSNNKLALILGRGPVNFTAKVGAVLLPQLVLQGNINDRERDVLYKSYAFMNQLKALPQNVTMQDFVKIDPSLEKSPIVKTYVKYQGQIPRQNLVDVLSYNYMLNLARAEKDWEIKGVEATLGIFGNIGVGVSMQKFQIENVASDGKVRKTVNEGIEQKSSLVNFEKLSDGRYLYTLKKIENLQENLRRIDAQGQFIDNGDTVQFVSSKVIDVNANIEVDTYGNEEVSYSFRENRNATKTTPPKVFETSNIEGQSLDRREAGKKIADDIYKWNRNDPVFDKIIVNISNGNYEAAYKSLQSNKKYANILNLVKTPDGQMNVDKMTELLTYTYGSSNAKNIRGGVVSKAEYAGSRVKKVVNTEASVFRDKMGVAVNPNEKAFEGKTHKQVSASDVFKGQYISMSVVATPSNLAKGAGTDRVDHFNKALEISNITAEISDINLKKSLINAYSSRINSEVQRINSDLGTNISKADYIAMLLGEKNPAEVAIGLQFKDTPKFFEARAMANHNICNNLTYGLAFPNFKINLPGETITTLPVVQSRLEAGSLVQKVRVSEFATGLDVSIFKKPTTTETTEIETTPGYEEVAYDTTPVDQVAKATTTNTVTKTVVEKVLKPTNVVMDKIPENLDLSDF